MINKNVWKDVQDPLGYFEDERGKIADIFFKKNINHVAIIHSEPNVMRGNHYHKHSTQHMLITKGSLEYWHKPLDSNEPPEVVTLKVGDFVSTPPYELHTLIIRDDGNEFIEDAFSTLLIPSDTRENRFKINSYVFLGIIPFSKDCVTFVRGFIVSLEKLV